MGIPHDESHMEDTDVINLYLRRAFFDICLCSKGGLVGAVDIGFP